MLLRKKHLPSSNSLLIPVFLIQGLRKRRSQNQSLKLRAQTVEELSTITKPITKVIEGDKDSKETDEDDSETDDLTFNDSPRKDATVESNTEDTSNLDVIVHTSDVDTNITTSANESKNTIPPKGSISKFNTEEYRSSNITDNLFDKESNVNIGENPLTCVLISSST
ncbi:unnamed protein product [Lactuca virosa]|uniref:Uncharacterized protein n=1 Tax=Lactuca virosa TaxID=75947 RepID=A0AAU9MIP3_9ASTR|nr:unnamed protein product [Lactuca virosa]